MFYIGIDLGTSSVKMILTDEAGTVLRRATRTYPISFVKDGWAEQNPQDWVDQTIDALRELLRDVDKSQVAAIGCGGQMHGLVALDAEDRVLRPAILWNDGRTDAECRWLNETIGEETLVSRTANIAFAGFTAPKLLWMKEHEPQLFARIHKWMLPKDYLTYRMTGVHATDVSDASGTLLFDVEHRTWSKEMLELCYLRAEQMPRVYESYEAVGTLLPSIAQELGLHGGVKWAAGAGDNAAAAIGTGAVGEGRCNLSVGTSGTIFIPTDRFCPSPSRGIHAFDAADGTYHYLACMLSAASCNAWWMEDILKTKDFAAEQAQIGELGMNDVYFLPYLMGERSPINDVSARGALIGMRLDTTRASMTQAVLEGVAFALRDSLEEVRGAGVEIAYATICGGGAKSPLWREILTNVLQLELAQPSCDEGPSFGAAILAMVASGVDESVRSAVKRVVKSTTVAVPNEALMRRYDAQYLRFRELYPRLKSWF